MQPSQQGRNNAGRPNPRANNSSLNPPSSTFPRDSQASSSSQVNADNSWYYPGGSSVQSSDSSASSSSDMIGPTPAFYDPAAAARQADTAAQYQLWLDSFGGQQQQQNVQAYQGSHHNQAYPQQPAHHQQQYPYTQGQSYQSHYPHGTASMTSQQGGMQTGDATQFAPQQQQVNDSYNDYYSTTQQSGTGSHNPDSGYSYSTSTNPSSYNTFTATPPQHPQPQGGHGQVPQHPQASGGGGTGHHFPTNPGAFPADTLHSGPQINRSTSNPPSASPTTNTWADDPYSSGQSSFTVGTGSSSSLSGAVPTISNPSTSTNPSPSQQPRQAPTATETTPTRQKRPAPQASSKPSTSTQQAPQASTTGKNKRRRKNPTPAAAAQETTLYTFDGSDSDSDDEQGGISVGMGGLGVVSSTGGRNNRL